MKILVLNPFACHLGYLGCYGNEWIATPNLDRMAAEGVVFDNHFAASLDPSPHTPATLDDWVGRAADLIASGDDLCWLDGPNLAPPWELADDVLALYTE